jgi:phage tail sheath protein FI
MPISYSSPGVYVEEVPSSIKAIAGVSTSTAGFIGVIPNTIQRPASDPANQNAAIYVDFTVPTAVATPVLLTNWSQFIAAFGDLVGLSTDTKTAVAQPQVNEGHRRLAQGVYGFFNNGGSQCYVARAADASGIAAVLTAFGTIDQIALVCAPGQTDEAVRDAIVTHCETLGDRFAILDGPQSVTDIQTLTQVSAGGTSTGVMPKTTTFAAWYFPWVTVFDPATQLLNPNGDGSLAVPPSGHLAGIYARVDTERGVFKAPANEVIRGALDVTQAISKADQATLNPVGVNCIRILNGNFYVWGARTIGGTANQDLMYVSVRRTLLFLSESIEQGTQWAVFEPNTPALWAKITRNITAFLTAFWRSGALFGTTAAEAFFVKCDAETNPAASRDLGQVITEIGVSIVRPAEFVIFRISQFVADSN